MAKMANISIGVVQNHHVVLIHLFEEGHDNFIALKITQNILNREEKLRMFSRNYID